ncbi:MAG: riboflavin synthase [Euryarchaeota archaeon]|nr:riboflavin synthase [Euryarchaeota archaeon]
MTRIGVADTTFARVDMAAEAIEVLLAKATGIELVRYTVPGIKDLPVACKRLFEVSGCELVMAFGMPGPERIDKQCAHEASMGLQQVQLLTNKHILEVFVHMDEVGCDADLYELARNRAREHALNAIALIEGPTALTPLAGTGQRQGFGDAGPVKATAKRSTGQRPQKKRHTSRRARGN